MEPDEAATPLTPDEMRGLIPAHIAYRRELNAAEQENILRAQDWALRRRRNLLTEKFIKDLHQQMLGDVWRWAGKFRNTHRNIGIDPWLIPIQLRELLADSKTWIECGTYRRVAERHRSEPGQAPETISTQGHGSRINIALR